MRILILFLLPIVGLAYTGTSPGTLVTDGTVSDVQAAITAATDGDIITIPSGNHTWASGITISGKGVHLQGGGSGRVIARSTSSVAVTGAAGNQRTLTLNASGLNISNGQTLKIERTGGDTTVMAYGMPVNRASMTGTVASYSGTTLVMDIVSVVGSGTHPLWIISTAPTTTITSTATIATSSGLIHATEDASHHVEISGIFFAYGSGIANKIFVTGAESGKVVKVHDCAAEIVYSGDASLFLRSASPRGLVWNCSFIGAPFSNGGQPIMIMPMDASFDAWLTTSTMGMADTTGLSNFYVEDCDFHGIQNSLDMSDNARVVVRNSLFNNAGIASHGPDTGTYGLRHFEIYDNEFVYNAYNDGNTLPLDYLIYIRGGTGVVTENIIPDVNSTDYGNKVEIKLQIQMLRRNAGPNGLWGSNNDTVITAISQANPTQISSTAHGMVTGDYVRITGSDSTPSVNGYHQITRINDNAYTIAVNVTVAGTTGKSNRVDRYCPRQVGLGRVSGTGVDGLGRGTDSITYVGDLEPLYVWGNTGTTGLSVSGGDPDTATDPDTETDYIREGFEYFNDATAKPGWTKPTSGNAMYPHPLRGESVATYTPGRLRFLRR